MIGVVAPGGERCLLTEAATLQGLVSRQHGVGKWGWTARRTTNGTGSFWAMLRRGCHGTFHRMSVKHLHRYVAEFAGRHNARGLGTLDQMWHLAIGLVGRRLQHRELVG